ncbi:MAG: hypothetical protein KJ970_17665 [Candidatus Eisenbacteria bacterium]|uniref:Uncharacterized protein n=1 Tax=Eiseniibacteriota bacterium TaxID=2212470 RepID=A0A948RXB2_UNCEI|nr:hypothetical protein [Candidatus Eisenbacteria bacterium]MBU1951240.1 hypothetical protein [Candidatus Eisenbacteria bacterium]MBU2692748.1 hypothetical protein [Candidatus Eisenbacteria bacterium]
MKRMVALGCVAVSVACHPHGAAADALTIYEIQQSSAETDWRSAYEGQRVSLTGGIVTHTIGFRITLQDPTLGDSWAGIEIRAFENDAPLGVVRVGDRVDFHDILVEEFRGGTIPQFKSYSTFEVISSGNDLPEPIIIPVEELSYPPHREQCEKYEGMLVAVENVRVGQMDWGKAEDNYELINDTHTMWASDYCNLDLAVPPFPTYAVRRGERYARIAGIFQEYLYPLEGWDYYQLLPRGEADYVISDIYTIRDIQESTSEDGWGSLLAGTRVALQALVSAERSSRALLALHDPLLGLEWAGISLRDPHGALSALAIGDDVQFQNLLVTEEEGLTVLLYDEESAHDVAGTGRPIIAAAIPADRISLSAPPDLAERFEGMLVKILGANVIRRAVPEGNDLYYLSSNTDLVLCTDRDCPAVPPDSTFFVRAGDCLGFIQGIVIEESIPGGRAYILQPRTTSDYYFTAGSQSLTTWGRLKQAHHGERQR